MADETRALVEEATRGDAHAVDELLERYIPGLEGYVRHHGRDLVGPRESGSDLVQSVCREVLERLGSERFQYRGEAEFRQWLYGAALLKIQNRRRYLRADMRDPRREVARACEPRTGTPPEAWLARLASPSSEAGRREELERVREAFERLPERDREVIVLAEFEGLPHREIADRLGVSEAYSRTILSRALAHLATLLTEPERG